MSTVTKTIRFTTTALLLSFGLISSFLPMVAHADSDRSDPSATGVLAKGQRPPKGLTSLFTIPNGLNGTFEQNGKVVNFETRRGPRTPKYLRNGDPDTPKFEIDVRFLNEHGETLLVQIGGSAPIDRTWTGAIEETRDDAEAKAEFEVASSAIEAIRPLKFNSQFGEEHKALMALSPALQSIQVVEKEGETQGYELSEPMVETTNIYRHRIQIHHKNILFSLARHSATIGKYISPTGVVTTAIITCNHGTCANHPSMTLKCLWTSAKPGNRSNRLKNWVACTTPYNATSIYGHNSNDDTDLQYQAVRYDYVPSFTGGICNNSSLNNEPTDCY